MQHADHKLSELKKILETDLVGENLMFIYSPKLTDLWKSSEFQGICPFIYSNFYDLFCLFDVYGHFLVPQLARNLVSAIYLFSIYAGD